VSFGSAQAKQKQAREFWVGVAAEIVAHKRALEVAIAEKPTRRFMIRNRIRVIKRHP
jgi:hypothetical protein